MTQQKALIIGAGIGGLTTALCLALKGYKVQVFEQASKVEEVGAGLQLSSNCSRVLHSLGLETALREKAFLPEAAEIRDYKSATLIASTPLGDAALLDYGFPYYHMHRADLLDLLLDAATRQPNIEIETATRIEEISQSASRVVLECTGRKVEGDFLIGADGIHSVTRKFLFGEQAPRFTGNVAWRGIVPADKIPAGMIRPVAGLWWGPGKHFVHYYVRSGQLINCVCVVEKAGWEIESWSERGNHNELKQDFQGWDDSICTLIEAMDPNECFKWALFDREPMSSWGRGRVTLLGDACHPTLPFLAQGAAMAIEDASLLAGCIEATDIEAGLQKYASLRMQRTARIQMASRRNAEVFHMKGMKAWVRNKAAKKASGKVLDWVYRYDVLGELNWS
jgi:salicylate hydroxylase